MKKNENKKISFEDLILGYLIEQLITKNAWFTIAVLLYKKYGVIILLS